MAKTSLLELQKAIYKRLNDDATLTALAPIKDFVKQGTAAPYVTIGRFDVIDFKTHSSPGEEVIAFINIWTVEKKGNKQAFLILDEITRLIGDKSDLVVTGFNFIASYFDGINTLVDNDGENRQTIARFRIQIQNSSGF